jgi:YVTN family beta-propeller protein
VSPTGDAVQPGSSPAESEPGGAEVVSIDLGAEAWSAKAGFGGIWVQVDAPVDEVQKIDVSTSEVVLGIPRGRNVAFGDDAVWVALGEEVVKIDPISGETRLTVPVEGSYLAFGAGSVWVAGPEGAVVRVDSTTGTPVASITVAPAEITEVAATDDAVWVTSKSVGGVYRIDPSTNAVITSIETGRGAHGVVIDPSGVWVTNYEESTVSRIDPVTNTVVATVEDVGSGVGIVAADGAIWVSTQGRGISRIDPATNGATLVAELPGWNYGIAYDEGALWVTDVDGKSLSRIAVDVP